MCNLLKHFSYFNHEDIDNIVSTLFEETEYSKIIPIDITEIFKKLNVNCYKKSFETSEAKLKESKINEIIFAMISLNYNESVDIYINNKITNVNMIRFIQARELACCIFNWDDIYDNIGVLDFVEADNGIYKINYNDVINALALSILMPKDVFPKLYIDLLSINQQLPKTVSQLSIMFDVPEMMVKERLKYLNLL